MAKRRSKSSVRVGTCGIAYVRFHGRNAKNWWRATNESRYDYLYAPAQLEPWAQRIVDMLKTALPNGTVQTAER